MSLENKNHVAVDRLLDIMTQLREKCPWDKKQTMESLRCLTIEETFELSDAIVDQNTDEIRKELGDILLHIVFYSQIAKEMNAFDFADVINSLCDKLIVRHPHVFGEVLVKNEEDVKVNWEKIKLNDKEHRKSVLGGVPKKLPAMIKAYRIQEKAHGVHFDWENAADIWNKVKEELSEFETEVAANDSQKMQAEFGDILFALINYARFKGINAEDALEQTNRKFIARFTAMENAITQDGKKLTDLTLPQMDIYWEKVKKKEKE
ncbi:MAG: nucleoside triphosphate pyrophosphohydrolase [Bacteroidales bacterium]|jgi:XTP/dITP diphosphohydrolase|nr:nucleoside triphosphate pyrophosphohydrolase [Bacteroidales bacterium]